MLQAFAVNCQVPENPFKFSRFFKASLQISEDNPFRQIKLIKEKNCQLLGKFFIFFFHLWNEHLKKVKTDFLLKSFTFFF